MKYIKYSIFFVLVASLLFSCKEDDNLHYSGKSIANFSKIEDVFYVTSEASTYDITVGLINPAAEDMTISLSVVKATDGGARVIIPGLNGNKVNVSIKKGDMSGKLTLSSNVNDFNEAKPDTLILKVDDPLFGRPNEQMLINDEILLVSKRFCTMTSEDLKTNWVGTFTGVSTIVNGTFTMSVSYIEGDTLRFANFSGLGNTIDVVVDLSTIPYSTKIVDGGLIVMSSNYGRWIARSLADGGQGAHVRGILDNCDGTLDIKFGIELPDINNGFGGYDQLKAWK